MIVRDLSKKFGNIIALNNVNFDLAFNEVLGVIGPNGSGKTTLINVLTGFIRPDRGSVKYMVNNMYIDITRLPPHKRVSLGIVRTFQGSRIYKDLTVKENLTYASMFSGMHISLDNQDAYLKEISYILEALDLKRYMDKRASELDNFHIKALELSMCLIRRPKVLLIDEIFSGLSHDEIAKIKDIISLYRKRYSISIIWVEHVVKALADAVDRMIAMNFGEIIAMGSPDEVLSSKAVISSYLGR